MRNIVVVVAAVLLAGVAHAETFEQATYRAPVDWKVVAGGYQRTAKTGGVGTIRLVPGHAASKRSAADEFAAMWRTNVEPDLKGSETPTAAPKPDVGVDGDMTIATGGMAVTVQGVQFNVVLATVVGRGRVFGISSIAAGDTAVAEVLAFFDAVKFDKPGAAPAPSPTTSTPPTMTSGLEFKAPPGYSISRESTIVLKPTRVDASTPCVYGIGPSRAASSSLEADAKAALGELLGDWKVKWPDHFEFRRGLAIGGWSFYWYRTVVQHEVGGQTEEANAMTMAISGAKGQTHIVYGIGSSVSCLLEDGSFLALFHSLRVPGASDSSKKFAAELAGNSWRWTTGSTSGPSGALQYTFSANGRYWYGLNSTTQVGYLETTSTTTADGSWSIKDGVLVLKPDRKDRKPEKIQIRLYDWPVGTSTARTLGWLPVGGTYERQFFRVGS